MTLKDKVLKMLRTGAQVSAVAGEMSCSESYVSTLRRTLVWTGELQPLKRGRK